MTDSHHHSKAESVHRGRSPRHGPSQRHKYKTTPSPPPPHSTNWRKEQPEFSLPEVVTDHHNHKEFSPTTITSTSSSSSTATTVTSKPGSPRNHKQRPSSPRAKPTATTVTSKPGSPRTCLKPPSPRMANNPASPALTQSSPHHGLDDDKEDTTRKSPSPVTRRRAVRPTRQRGSSMDDGSGTRSVSSTTTPRRGSPISRMRGNNISNSRGVAGSSSRSTSNSKRVSFSRVSIQEFDPMVMTSRDGSKLLTMSWKPSNCWEGDLIDFDDMRTREGRRTVDWMSETHSRLAALPALSRSDSFEFDTEPTSNQVTPELREFLSTMGPKFERYSGSLALLGVRSVEDLCSEYTESDLVVDAGLQLIPARLLVTHAKAYMRGEDANAVRQRRMSRPDAHKPSTPPATSLESGSTYTYYKIRPSRAATTDTIDLAKAGSSKLTPLESPGESDTHVWPAPGEP